MTTRVPNPVTPKNEAETKVLKMLSDAVGMPHGGARLRALADVIIAANDGNEDGSVGNSFTDWVAYAAAELQRGTMHHFHGNDK